jgi:hypothetical protein
MATQYIQVPVDSIGKKVQTFENIINSQVVQTQATTPVDATGVTFSRVNPFPTSAIVASTSVRVNSSAFESAHILKASAGRLISLQVSTTAVSDQIIQLFDTPTVPSNGTAPVCFFRIPANTDLGTDIPVVGLPFTNGIVVSNSTTVAIKTSGASDCWYTAVVL